MPADVGGEWIGDLCNHHAACVASMAHLDHVSHSDSREVAKSVARQCPECIKRKAA